METLFRRDAPSILLLQNYDKAVTQLSLRFHLDFVYSPELARVFRVAQEGLPLLSLSMVPDLVFVHYHHHIFHLEVFVQRVSQSFGPKVRFLQIGRNVA